jgi:RND family efflux transporter MFP subunit
MKETTKKKHPLRYLPLVLLVGAVVVYWRLDAGRERTKAAALIPTVRVEKPARRDLVEEFTLKSHIEAENTVTVLPLVSGVLQAVEADAGDRVARDQVLARIDAARYELQLVQAEASYLAAKSTFERMAQLYQANAGSRQNYDQAQAQFDATRSQWELAKLQLGYATVRSPVDGVLLVRHLSVGDFAAPERPIATIGDLSRLVVRARVPEGRYARFVRGSVGIRLDVGGQTYPASVSSLAPFVSADTRTFEVVCLIGGDLAALRPGMSAAVTFALDARPRTLSLPYTALGYSRELWYVTGDSARRMIAPELFSDGVRFEVPEETADIAFIVEGQHFLTEGQAVKAIGAGQ